MVNRKKREANNHGGMNSILIPEIIFNILLRLPAYDLHRIKKVCRMWFEIISSREFLAEHLEYWRFKPEIVYLLRNDSEYFLTSLGNKTKKEQCQLNLGKYEEESLHLLSTLDGLLLFLIIGYTTRRVYICNPVTQKFKLLLYVPTSWDHGGPAYTLVYDSVQQNYKVIGFCYRAPNLCIHKKYCVLSFTSDEGRRRTRGDFKVPVWRTVDKQYRHISRVHFVAISIGRVLYWIACTVTGKTSYIQTMDIIDEVFTDKIPLPRQPVHEHWGTCRLLRMESRESLYVAMPCSKTEIGIWVMKPGEGYEWMKQHNISLGTMVGRPYNLNAFNDYTFELHSAVDTEDSNSTKLVMRFDRNLYTYSLKKRELTLLSDRSSDSTYVSSFVSWEKCKNVMRL